MQDSSLAFSKEAVAELKTVAAAVAELKAVAAAGKTEAAVAALGKQARGCSCSERFTHA